jgi:rod shape determining protein RodA
LWLALVLAVIGLLNLHSATHSVELTGMAHDAFEKWTMDQRARFPWFPTSKLFWSQVVYTLMGIALMLVVSRISLRHLYGASSYIYLFSLLLLALVLVMGAKVNGSLSWLDLGIVRLQPSEFAKLGLVLMLSRHLADFEKNYSLGLLELISPSLIFFIPMILVLVQNDLGTSMFFGLIFGTLLMVQGVDWRLILVAVLLVSVTGVVGYRFFLKPYQKDRIVQFSNPEQDARGAGYHLVQSKIAVGSGSLLGKGYLKGSSNKLKFLPERHTDFIYPVLAEEWGFVGTATVLLFYFCFLVMGISIAARSRNRFGIFVSIGVVSIFFWHMVVNLGGVLGLMPLTGVPFPLFSYGGSSLLATWTALGVLMSAYRSR